MFIPGLHKSQIAASEQFGIKRTLSAANHGLDSRPEHSLQAIIKAAYVQHLVTRLQCFLNAQYELFSPLFWFVPGNLPHPSSGPFVFVCIDKDDGSFNL